MTVTERAASKAFCEAMQAVGTAVAMRRKAPDATAADPIQRAADRYSRRAIVLVLRG